MSWPTVALGEFMPSKIPSVNPAKFPAETFELWSIPAFDAGEPETLLGSDIGSSKKCITPGDVLLSRIVPHIRRSCVVAPRTSYRQIASGEWITFRGNAFDPNYMRQILVSDPFNAEFMQTVAGVGGSLLRARPEGVKLIKIPLPPLEEQKRIAGILDQADALRRLRTRALDKLNTLGQAIFHEMFGDGGDSALMTPLVDLTSKIGSGATPRGGDAAYKAEGVPLIRSMNVRDGSFDRKGLAFLDDDQAEGLKNVIVQGNDVLLNITGASVARVSLAPAELSGARVNQHVAIIRPTPELLPEFLEAFLLLPTVKRTLLGIAEAGATRQAITKSQIEEFRVPKLPIEAQSKFVARRNAAAQMSVRYAQHQALLEANFASLQHRAFHGKL